MLADTPADVRAYAAEHDAFPNETTVNQWFSESQFESYRALGAFQAAKLIGEKMLPQDQPLVGLFERVRGRS